MSEKTKQSKSKKSVIAKEELADGLAINNADEQSHINDSSISVDESSTKSESEESTIQAASVEDSIDLDSYITPDVRDLNDDNVTWVTDPSIMSKESMAATEKLIMRRQQESELGIVEPTIEVPDYVVRDGSSTNTFPSTSYMPDEDFDQLKESLEQARDHAINSSVKAYRCSYSLCGIFWNREDLIIYLDSATGGDKYLCPKCREKVFKV